MPVLYIDVSEVGIKGGVGIRQLIEGKVGLFLRLSNLSNTTPQYHSYQPLLNVMPSMVLERADLSLWT